MIAANQAMFDPTQLVLEFEPEQASQAWTKSQAAATAQSRWQSYLNQLVLDILLPWLQAEEDAQAQGEFTPARQANLWELVNGTAIKLQDTKLVVIPTEAADASEIRVPQEWIDIPTWSADYYLGVQVNVDAGYIRVWGYATHQQLKTVGSFSQSDRTYSLAPEQMITDLNVLWVARELCPGEVTQVALEPIAALAKVQGENLVQRLGSPSLLLPRLAVPFSLWAALLLDQHLCSSLAATRKGTPAKANILQWLSQGADSLAAELGWRRIEMIPSFGGARSAAVAEVNSPANSAVPTLGMAKQIAIASQPYELRILPLAEAGSWRFELGCLTPGCMIPAGFKLRLLTAKMQTFAGNEALATEPVEQLFIEVDLEPGESLICQVEPAPADYQPEVWQF